MIRKGRKILYTDATEITYENIVDILRLKIDGMIENARDCEFLINYDKGIQPLTRKKVARTSIDIKVVDNVAAEISTFWQGFVWGNPITMIARGSKDSGSQTESNAIALLNENYYAAKLKKRTQELAYFVEITGIGYTMVDVNANWKDGDSYFTLDVLDPRNAFVIYSSYYVDKRPMVAVSYRQDESGNTHYTCFTNKYKFEIINLREIENGEVVRDEWNHTVRSGEVNPLGMIPIIEWTRAVDRMGVFERVIDDCDALNIIESDICNATDESVNAIWHANDVDFPVDVITDAEGNSVEIPRKPVDGDWLQTFTPRDGKAPFVKPLSSNFDYNGNLNYALNKRALILEKCDVPERNDNSGGSTGIAMGDATGWSRAETAACKEQNIIEDCKMEEVKLVLRAIELNSNAPDELKTLRAIDVEPNIKRQKTYELTTKINFFATAVSHGINGKHALQAMNAFEDANQVWVDSKDLIEMYQNSIFNKDTEAEDRLQADYSDQEENSPNMK